MAEDGRRCGVEATAAPGDIRCEGAQAPSLALAGDSRAALRPRRGRPDRAGRARRPRRCPTASRRRSRWSARAARTHGDYATNVALQLGKKSEPGQPARAGRAARRRARADRRASPRSTSPGPGFLNITVAAGAQGQVAADIVAAGCVVRLLHASSPARRSTSSSSRPTRPARSTSAASGGRPSATRSAGSSSKAGAEVTREYYFNDHGAQIDRFARSLLASAQGRAGARGRVRRRLHRRDRAARCWPSGPTPSTLPDDEAQEVFRAEGVDMMFAEIKESLHAVRRRLRRLLPREQPARAAARSSRRSSGSPRSATPTSRTARSGCAPRSTATTRTG